MTTAFQYVPDAWQANAFQIDGAPASISAIPASIPASSTTSVTVTGVNTTWLSTPPSFSLAGVAGLSISSTTVVSDTSAVIVVVSGAPTGIATLTEATSGAGCLLFVIVAAVPGGGGPPASSGTFAVPLDRAGFNPLSPGRQRTRKSGVAVEFNLGAGASSESSFPFLEAAASAVVTWKNGVKTRTSRHDQTDYIRRQDDSFLIALELGDLTLMEALEETLGG